MKKLISIFSALLFLVNVGISQDAIEKYFEKYLDDPELTSVYISPKMFDMLGDIEIDEMDDELQLMIKNMKGLRILRSETNSKNHYQEALGIIENKSFDKLMEVRDHGENIKFYVQESGDYINELLLLVGGDEQFVLMSFTGKISLDQISKLANKMNISGSEHLQKLKDVDKK